MKTYFICKTIDNEIIDDERCIGCIEYGSLLYFTDIDGNIIYAVNIDSVKLVYKKLKES